MRLCPLRSVWALCWWGGNDHHGPCSLVQLGDFHGTGSLPDLQLQTIRRDQRAAERGDKRKRLDGTDPDQSTNR